MIFKYINILGKIKSYRKLKIIKYYNLHIITFNNEGVNKIRAKNVKVNVYMCVQS